MAQTTSMTMYLEDLARKTETGLKNRLAKMLWPAFVEEVATKKMIEREQDIEDMGPLRAWRENSPRQEMQYGAGYSQSYRQTQWAGLVDRSKALLKLGDRMMLDRLNRQLVDTTGKTQEVLFHAYLEYGDVALASVPKVNGEPMINSLGGDGLTLFNTAHTWKTGSDTWANKSASLDSLTDTAIKTAVARIRRWTASDGTPLQVNVNALRVPVELETDALKVLKSLKSPDTANNAANYVPMIMSAAAPVVDPWLASAVDWYLHTDAQEGKIKCFWGWRPELNPKATNPRTGNECFSIDFSIAHGANKLLSCYKVTA
jgi:hypothetical protein